MHMQEEVKSALETFCSLLPGNYSSNCTTFIDDKFDDIWKLLKEGIVSTTPYSMTFAPLMLRVWRGEYGVEL